MKFKRIPVVAAILVSMAMAGTVVVPATALAADAPAVQVKEGWFTKLANLDLVKEKAVLPQIEGVMIIDSRPTTRKYDIGHIQTAVNIPDLNFDKLAPTLLPQDKSTLLIFYCDGPECMLSHNSAFKAEKLGYTNVRVFAEGFPEWIKNGNPHAISIPYLKKLMDEKSPLTLIDSRPKARKYDLGHIPGAISLPDSQFDKLAAEKLPTDKTAALYFYCEGLSCSLSNESALKAAKLGYTNVKVVPDGYPGWAKAYGSGPAAGDTVAANTSKAPAIEAGKESGSIAVASFERIYREAPDSVHLIDVREPSEFASGSFKGAINMPINSLEKNLGKLPTDKPIIFFCGAGARSGEAHDMVKLYRPELKTVYLDANVKWTKLGEFTINGKS